MGFCAIGDVFLQRTSHTDLPRVDVFALQLEAINKALAEMAADGTLTALSEKYFNADISKEA